MNSQPPRGPDDQGGRRQRTKRLGDQLRRIYDSVANEGAPDDFLQLLNEADRKRGTAEKGAAESDGADKSSKED